MSSHKNDCYVTILFLLMIEEQVLRLLFSGFNECLVVEKLMKSLHESIQLFLICHPVLIAKP